MIILAIDLGKFNSVSCRRVPLLACPAVLRWSRTLLGKPAVAPGDVNTVGREPAIRVTKPEATAITQAEKLTKVPATAREALAIKIRMLREYTNAPISALKELVRLSRERHPWDYLPLHRMDELP